MSKCKDCKYAQDSGYEIAGVKCCTCTLTRRVMNENAESECNCFNRDLSAYDICYNCAYYIGGGDWGLFCSHRDMYHHLGKFSDEPCKRYERRPMAEIRLPIQVNLPDDWMEQIVNRLRNDPEAEWVEIVRCKDCKYWREHKYAKETKRYIPFCGFNAINTKADDYCSRAERRTDEQTN